MGRLPLRRVPLPAFLLLATSGAGAPAAGGDRLLAAGDLGGIARIVRFAVAQPDRAETAYLFLAPPRIAGGPPEQVQIIGDGGEALQLADTAKADCTLERVVIRTRREGGPVVVYARRTFSGDLTRDDTTAPAAMAITTFRPVRGTDPGDSSIVLHRVGGARTSRPVCRAADVLAEMTRLTAPAKAAR